MDNEKTILVSSWDDIEYIFDLRNKFAHNPMHLRDGVLVLSIDGDEEFYTEKEINDIRDALVRIEDDLKSIISSSGFSGINFGFEEISDEELCLV